MTGFVRRWCDLDSCDHASCSLLTYVAVVSCVARADENSLRHVERHAMGDLKAMRIWNRRSTAASIATQAMSPCAGLSIRATSTGFNCRIIPETYSLERLQRAVGHYDEFIVRVQCTVSWVDQLTTELHVRTKKSESSTQRAGHVANFHEGNHLDLA